MTELTKKVPGIGYNMHKPCPRCGTGKALFSTKKQKICDSCLDIRGVICHTSMTQN